MLLLVVGPAAAPTLLSVLGLNSALTTRSATSARAMEPHTLVSAVSLPLPVAASLVRPPGRMMVYAILSPSACRSVCRKWGARECV